MRSGDYALWVYGSYARGDADCLSDFDVLLVGSPPQGWRLPQQLASRRPSVSRYSWKELATMLSYGSLFLHHLRLEGRRLASLGPRSERFSEELRELKPYGRWQTDLNAFRLTLRDVVESIEEGCCTPYELGVTATVLRHAAILGCYLLGAPSFGRRSAFVTIAGILGFVDADVDSWTRAYLFKLYDEGRVELPYEPEVGEILFAVDSAETLVNRIEEEVAWTPASAFAS